MKTGQGVDEVIAFIEARAAWGGKHRGAQKNGRPEAPEVREERTYAKPTARRPPDTGRFY